MKIAITYENGKIFQHFGKTEQFKIYTVEDEKIVSSEVVNTNGSGHGALGAFLAEQKVDVVICGGIGEHAQGVLEEAGIELCSGVSGDADEAAEYYLQGELISTGANCDHKHHGEGEADGGHGCGSGCGEHGCGGNGNTEDAEAEGCGGGCGSCGGGCGGNAGPRVDLSAKNFGKKCKVHYRGTFNDGTQFDSSYDRGEPLEFICGTGMMIPGFDKAVSEMEIGEVVEVHLMPEEAYGPADPNAIITVAITDLPGSEGLNVGQQVYLSNQMGQPFMVTVIAKDETNITFDANHEMAGKELNFKIELVSAE